jgi:hypothetical protein
VAKIYVSSTYEDLEDCREAVYQTLRRMRHDVIAMEDYTAGEERPLDRCLEDVRNADVYVGLFAFRFGFVPRGHEASITELELREAERTGKPVLAFLLRDDAPWPPKFVDEDRTEIDRVRAHLQDRYTVAFFETSEGLANEVGVAVNALDRADEDAAREPAPTPTEDLSSSVGFFRDFVSSRLQRAARDVRFYNVLIGVLIGLGSVLAAAGLLLSGPLAGLSALIVPAFSVYPANRRISSKKRWELMEDLKRGLDEEPPPEGVLRIVDHYVNQLVGAEAA